MKYNIDEILFSELLPEMFNRVGLTGNDINDLTKIPSWFTTQNWTTAQEREFKFWLIDKLRTKLNLTCKQALREADMFLLNYGWSTGQEKQLELNLGD